MEASKYWLWPSLFELMNPWFLIFARGWFVSRYGSAVAGLTASVAAFSRLLMENAYTNSNHTKLFRNRNVETDIFVL